MIRAPERQRALSTPEKRADDHEAESTPPKHGGPDPRRVAAVPDPRRVGPRAADVLDDINENNSKGRMDRGRFNDMVIEYYSMNYSMTKPF